MKNILKVTILILSFILLTSMDVISSTRETQDASNLLKNPSFEFHSFVNHREGTPVSYASHNVAFWNTDVWGDIEVVRESHVPDSVKPVFSTHNLIAITPGKKIWQFFTLPEADLSYGEKLSLSVYAYQKEGDQLKSKIKLMKTDSEDGEWSPKDFGMRDSRSFPKHARGELVVAKEYNTSLKDPGIVNLIIEDAVIIGKTGVGNKSSSNDINTIGIQVEFENLSLTDTV
ncbi:MAG: hypothetical protein PHI32_10460 [Dysgonamonadaceae bacterium]|nr:hypothetical protein [Dysgonamonadaceae bacterium]